MRIALAGLAHETNTYAVASSGLTTYQDFKVLRDQEILDVYGTALYVGGFVAAAAELGAQVVPTYWAGSDPSGTIEQATYERLRAELLAALEDAAPFDALAIELHGAAVAEQTHDVEGDLGRHLRAAFPDIPIVSAADLHGNYTDEMAQTYDVVLPVELYPHTDTFARGYEAVMLLPDLLEGTLRPAVHVEHLPMLLPTTTTDPGHPGAALVALMHGAEERAGVVDCSVWHGFPFTDTADVGVHVVLTTNGDPDLAAQLAREVAGEIWESRDRYRPQVLTPEEAIARALSLDATPVVINETSDNPGAGTPGDGTHLLRAMVDAGLQDACFGMICDPAVVDVAVTAGVGATIEVELGGKSDNLHGTPVRLTAYVKTITDGSWVSQVLAPGMRGHHGRMVRLVAGGIDILVSEERSQTWEPEIFLLHGIDITRYRVVALKGSSHFRAGFSPMAGAILTADSPGLSTLSPGHFTRDRLTRKVWPLDADAHYAALGGRA